METGKTSDQVNHSQLNLVRNSDAKVSFTIKVIDSEEINAFALPGGFFFVNTGILLNADNEGHRKCPQPQKSEVWNDECF